MRKSETRLINHNESVDNILRGIEKAANIITSTMGGEGKNVLLFENHTLQFTKDGVSVARKIQLPSTEEDAGAKLLITAANKTVKECGDGTTLTSLLVREFTTKLFKMCQTRSINEVLLEFSEQIDKLKEELLKRSTKIETLDQIYNIALTSSKSNKLATLIYEIYRKVGLKASISVQLSDHSPQSYYEVTKGLNFDGGFIHPGFANQLNGTFQAEKPTIVISEEVMNDFLAYAEAIEELHNKKVPLVIIAKDFSDSFIRYALTNKQTKDLNICLIKLPGWGDMIKENIRDIKAFWSNGEVNKITVSQSEFTLYNNPNPKKIRTRVQQLEAQINSATEEFDVMDFYRRIDDLNQTSAIIYVGGKTLANAQEEFDRIEDAVGACQAACKAGFVKGAGSELVDIAENLTWTNEFQDILYAPTKQILRNANVNINPSSEPYNTKTKTVDKNLIDPVNVIISAFQNSFALAELLINTSTILYD